MFIFITVGLHIFTQIWACVKAIMCPYIWIWINMRIYGFILRCATLKGERYVQMHRVCMNIIYRQRNREEFIFIFINKIAVNFVVNIKTFILCKIKDTREYETESFQLSLNSNLQLFHAFTVTIVILILSLKKQAQRSLQLSMPIYPPFKM